MTYIPKNKIEINLYTDGSEFVYAKDKSKPYTGYFHRLFTGKTYTGQNQYDIPIEEIIPFVPTVNPTSYNDEYVKNSNNVIYNIYTNPSVVNSNYVYSTSSFEYALKKDELLNFIPRKVPTKTVSFPTKDDYNNGYFIRYFAYNLLLSSFFETDKNTFDDWQKNSSDLSYATDVFSLYSVTWNLIGDIESVFNSNKQTVDFIQKNSNIPGLDSFLKFNFLQFYQYSEQDNLFTSGNELITTKGEFFSGYYHVEKLKGPTMGPFPLPGQPRLLYKKYSPQFQEKKTTQNLGIG